MADHVSCCSSAGRLSMTNDGLKHAAVIDATRMIDRPFVVERVRIVALSRGVDRNANLFKSGAAPLYLATFWSASAEVAVREVENFKRRSEA
jgi:hypothetical protein